jgi:hypothetical protein
VSPTNSAYGAPLTGLDAELAASGIATAPRGGVDGSFDGVFSPRSAPSSPMAPEHPFAGMGPLLEGDDATVFRTVHNMVLRQERLAKNRLAIDTHWTRVKLNYPWSALEKVQDQDIWRAVLPPGSEKLRAAAVPNKAADLCGKVVETLMVDPPQPAPAPEDDSETAERAAEMAEEFLTQDGGEAGTNDASLFWSALDAATTRSSAFLHLWVDKTGGGYVPLQIKAHPQAVDAQHPLVGPDGMPTTDYILRYVTAGGQFTDDPSQAAPQWLPKIRVDVRYREHVRTFPETADVHGAEQVVLLDYCTLGEAKRRWQSIRELPPDQQAELLDWTPPRYLTLLPPALRARWKLQTGDQKDMPGGANDERLLFFYTLHRRATPDYPRGASLYVTGAFGGFIIDKETLAASIQLGTGGTDVRCRDLPIVQIRLLQDVDDRDPMGRPLIERFGGANEAAATLITAYLEAIHKLLNPAKFIPSTSPVQGWQIEQSRGTGDPVMVLSRDDYPHYEEPPPLPPGLLDVIQWDYEQMNSASGVTKPAMGADDQQEVSGVARNIAVRQALVSLSRMQQATLAAWERYWRIKVQLAMAAFDVPQQLRYVGEDGAYKQEWWTGVDFALVTDVGIQPGTGTMMPPAEKVNYLAALTGQRFIGQDEAADAARPSFAETLGLPENPHQQHVERQVSAWLQGPPEGWQPGGQQIDPMTGQVVQTPANWTPFQPLPCDDEPEIAALRKRRLAKLMATARYTAQPPEWRALVDGEYQRMRQAVAMASQPPMQGQIAGQIGGAPTQPGQAPGPNASAGPNPPATDQQQPLAA